ncbi:MAG: FKBP-type peptidyl-prolyl cis-trans isomerase [Pseudomonadota bacterium]|jgi:FKBP-type peptidyl-prolyl cis-trans isomerase SlyD
MHIERDKAVTFHYSLSEAGGARIETSRERAPQAYLHGHRNLLPALEEQLAGHVAGDVLSVTLAPEQAYGPRREGATTRVPIKHLVFEGGLAPGQVVGIRTGGGLRRATVVKAGKFNADLDFNHPLAGKTLVFDIEVLAVRDATAEELAHGHVHGAGGHHH